MAGPADLLRAANSLEPVEDLNSITIHPPTVDRQDSAGLPPGLFARWLAPLDYVRYVHKFALTLKALPPKTDESRFLFDMHQSRWSNIPPGARNMQVKTKNLHFAEQTSLRAAQRSLPSRSCPSAGRLERLEPAVLLRYLNPIPCRCRRKLVICVSPRSWWLMSSYH